jgi:hypothetical protein
MAGKEKWRGLSLIAKPSENVIGEFICFLNELKKICGNQFYYKKNEIHVTIMAIVTCQPQFRLDGVNAQRYIEIVRRSLANVEPFSLLFNGITVSTSCVIAKGYYFCDEVFEIRNELRSGFKQSRTFNTMDHRYYSETSHCTLLRFHEILPDRYGALELIGKSKGKNFGKATIDELELVYGDWSLTEGNTECLQKFMLSGQ